MANATNVRIRYAQLTYGANDLGHIQGGVKFTYNPKFTDLAVDQYGKSRVDMALDSEEVKVTANLAEVVYNTFKNVLTLGTYTSGTSPYGKVVAGSNAAVLGSASAAQLTIHPSNRTDASEDIVVFKAVVTDIGDLEYTPDKQSVVPVTWTAIIDENQAAGGRLFRIGPSAVS